MAPPFAQAGVGGKSARAGWKECDRKGCWWCTDFESVVLHHINTTKPYQSQQHVLALSDGRRFGEQKSTCCGGVKLFPAARDALEAKLRAPTDGMLSSLLRAEKHRWHSLTGASAWQLPFHARPLSAARRTRAHPP